MTPATVLATVPYERITHSIVVARRIQLDCPDTALVEHMAQRIDVLLDELHRRLPRSTGASPEWE